MDDEFDEKKEDKNDNVIMPFLFPYYGGFSGASFPVNIGIPPAPIDSFTDDKDDEDQLGR